MNVLKIEDQEDGSAIIEMEMSETERDFLIEFGFNEMLKKVVKGFEDEINIRPSVSDTE